MRPEAVTAASSRNRREGNDMGANFCTMSVPTSHSREAVRQQFRAAQDADRYENGHSYSGGFGMATSLLFVEGLLFPSVTEAEHYLQEHCVKWEDAQAVKHNTLDGVEMWLIGAWCAS